jgi:hypothetical protein
MIQKTGRYDFHGTSSNVDEDTLPEKRIAELDAASKA